MRIGRVRDVLAARLDELLGEFRLRVGGRGRGHGRFDDAEADVVAAAEPGRHAGAVGGAAIVGQRTVGRLFSRPHDPSAAHHAGQACPRPHGIHLWLRRIGTVPVQHPLGRVGIHVLQAPGVGLAAGGRLAATREQAGGSGACGVLPFRFGGQAVASLLFTVEPFAEGYGILPTDAGGVGSEAAGAFLLVETETGELFGGDLGLGHEKVVRDPDLVNRPLVRVAVREQRELFQQLGVGGLVAAHAEGSSRDPQHPDSDGVHPLAGRRILRQCRGPKQSAECRGGRDGSSLQRASCSGWCGLARFTLDPKPFRG